MASHSIPRWEIPKLAGFVGSRVPFKACTISGPVIGICQCERLSPPVVAEIRIFGMPARCKIKVLAQQLAQIGSRISWSAFPCAILARSAGDTGSESRNARARALDANG